MPEAARRRTATELLGRLAVCLLVVALTDVAVIARVAWLDSHACGATCAMCLCKRNAETTRLRTECPCCRPQAAVLGPLTDRGPALVAGPPVCVVHSRAARPVLARVDRPTSHSPDVPHPPPRVRALA